MEKEKKKKRWQEIKEGWYSHVHLSLKAIDRIIGVALFLLLVTVILIVLEATGTFTLFPS